MKRLLLFLLLSLVTGCSHFVAAPEVAFRELKLTGAGTGGLSFDIDLGVKNPNSFDLRLDGYTYRLRVTDLPLATGGIRDTFVFPAGEETDLRIPVQVGYTDMLEILRHRPDPDRIPYQLSAGLEVSAPFGKMYIPIEKGGTLRVPDRFRPTFYLNILKGLLTQGGEEEAEADGELGLTK